MVDSQTRAFSVVFLKPQWSNHFNLIDENLFTLKSIPC